MTDELIKQRNFAYWLGLLLALFAFGIIIAYNLYILREQLIATGTSYNLNAIMSVWQKEVRFQAGLYFITVVASLFVMRYLHLRLTEADQKLKHAEKIEMLRYQLLDYATMHTVDELLQYALHEICQISSSQMGFYHFVDVDQQTITSQTWSDRAMQEFAITDNDCRHCTVEQVGICNDLIASRNPVIHNDATSITEKTFLENRFKVVRELIVPVIRDERIVAVLGVWNKAENYTNKDAEDVLYLADVAWEIIDTRRAYQELKQANELLARQARVDFLTGIYNRRMFEQMMDAEIARQQRYGFTLALIMFDIDHFKRVNDTLGHAGGDLVLQKIAELVSCRIRSHDIFCRWGGEEFIILLPSSSLCQAAVLAEILRSMVEQHDFKNSMQITLSFGAAEYQCKEPPHNFIKRADTALYKAKQQGRNQVVLDEL
ncbi:MAG: sensor domain-containing diguanylate cyclase [Trichlorobacter sp.]|nr:sensor domain-containing diguanylate cyclase [Trichlorobacter sp.]